LLLDHRQPPSLSSRVRLLAWLECCQGSKRFESGCLFWPGVKELGNPGLSACVRRRPRCRQFATPYGDSWPIAAILSPGPSRANACRIGSSGATETRRCRGRTAAEQHDAAGRKRPLKSRLRVPKKCSNLATFWLRYKVRPMRRRRQGPKLALRYRFGSEKHRTQTQVPLLAADWLGSGYDLATLKDQGASSTELTP